MTCKLTKLSLPDAISVESSEATFFPVRLTIEKSNDFHLVSMINHRASFMFSHNFSVAKTFVGISEHASSSFNANEVSKRYLEDLLTEVSVRVHINK